MIQIDSRVKAIYRSPILKLGGWGCVGSVVGYVTRLICGNLKFCKVKNLVLNFVLNFEDFDETGM